MGEPTLEEVAEVLDGMYDVLLEKGRCRKQLIGLDGSVCLVRAAAVSARARYADRLLRDRIRDDALDALRRQVCPDSPGVVIWNWDTADDDLVFDAIQRAAKHLREQAGAA